MGDVGEQKGCIWTAGRDILQNLRVSLWRLESCKERIKTASSFVRTHVRLENGWLIFMKFGVNNNCRHSKILIKAWWKYKTLYIKIICLFLMHHQSSSKNLFWKTMFWTEVESMLSASLLVLEISTILSFTPRERRKILRQFIRISSLHIRLEPRTLSALVIARNLILVYNIQKYVKKKKVSL